MPTPPTSALSARGRRRPTVGIARDLREASEPRLGILTTVTNAWTFDGDSQNFDGRSFKIMSNLSLRLTGEKAIGGWLLHAIVARYFYDHHIDPTGDLDGTFHGFGFGIGFSSE